MKTVLPLPYVCAFRAPLSAAPQEIVAIAVILQRPLMACSVAVLGAAVAIAVIPLMALSAAAVGVAVVVVASKVIAVDPVQCPAQVVLATEIVFLALPNVSVTQLVVKLLSAILIAGSLSASAVDAR